MAYRAGAFISTGLQSKPTNHHDEAGEARAVLRRGELRKRIMNFQDMAGQVLRFGRQWRRPGLAVLSTRWTHWKFLHQSMQNPRSSSYCVAAATPMNGDSHSGRGLPVCTARRGTLRTRG